MSRPGMRPMAPGERERLQQFHGGAMQDRAAIGSPSAIETPCRVAANTDEAIFLSSGATEGVTFHFPVDTAYTPGMHIWHTERHGELLVPVEYIPVGKPKRSTLALAVDCRKAA